MYSIKLFSGRIRRRRGRRRCSRSGGPVRPALESLEHRLLLAGDMLFDFGDAPDTGAGVGTANYQTSLADDGAMHRMVSGLHLGNRVDVESEASPNGAADGDDAAPALDDEDGIVNPLVDLTLTTGVAQTVRLNATNATSQNATLFGWIDFDGDGEFELAERASATVANDSSGEVQLVFPATPSGASQVTYARFRISTDPAAGSPTGLAEDGEVEDYQVFITPPNYQANLLRELDSSGPSSPTGFTGVGELTYFAANADELWQTDGSESGTLLVKDIVPDSEAPFGPSYLTDVAGTLHFASGNDLWTSDGSPAGTTSLKTFQNGPAELTAVNGDLFFLAAGTDDQGVEHPYTLWRSRQAMVTAVTAASGETFEDVRHLIAFQDDLFFFGRGVDPSDNVTKWGLWRTSGQADGYEFLRTFPPINGNPDVSEFAAAGSNLFFFADDGQHGKELWKSDGTAAGTQLVRDINPAGSSMFSFGDKLSESIGDTLYFIANDGISGRELWRSDGTTGGTTMISDLNPNGDFFNTFGDTALLSAVNNELFFTAGGGPLRDKLWKTDGTANGTGIVAEGLSSPRDLTALGGTLLFTSSSRLWQSDGTSAGTVELAGPRSPVFLAAVNQSLFFSAQDETAGNSEPWIFADRRPPLVTINDAQAAEGDGSGTTDVTFTVTVQGAAGSPFEVDYSIALTSDVGPLNAATLGDLSAVPPSGVLQFSGTDGEQQTVTVSLQADGVVELDETFVVNLTGVSNSAVLLRDSQGRGIIRNDDSATISIDDVSALEGQAGSSTAFQFTVSLLGEVDTGLSVSYETADGSATTADGDYDASSGMLTFSGAQDETKTFTVLVHGDSTAESDETFAVILDSIAASGRNIVFLDQEAVGEIRDDDGSIGFDFGDAPPGYQVLLADDGARHAARGPALGTSRDEEPDGQPSDAADGDDNSGAVDDEDGVSLVASLVATADRATVSSLIANASQSAKLDAWLDFNQDGDWDDVGEQLFAGQPLVAGDNLLGFTIPAGASPGEVAARFRISSSGGLPPGGEAADGEVEDYLFALLGGSNSNPADVQIELPIPGNLEVAADGDEIVARRGAIELFRAPLGVLDKVKLVGTSGNDAFDLANIDAVFSGAIEIDAAGGEDILRLLGSGQMLVLSGASASVLRGIESIDIQGDGDNTMMLDRDALMQVSPNGTLRVTANAGDQVKIGTGWQLSGASVDNGKLVRAMTQGGATLELIGPYDWSNPINPLDVDGDGFIVPLDALLVINELNDPRFSDGSRLTDAAQLATFPMRFLDVVPDNFVAPIDALRIINYLNDLAEGEATAEPVLGDVYQAPNASHRLDQAATKSLSPNVPDVRLAATLTVLPALVSPPATERTVRVAMRRVFDEPLVTNDLLTLSEAADQSVS